MSTTLPTPGASVKLADIRCDSGTQSRLSISENAVAEYCERMTAGDEFPPLDVFFDGNEYHLADGFHRTLAAERAGIKEFQCNVHKGTIQDAIWFSIGANSKNGERRSPSDKRNCIEIALNRFPDKSQEQIAQHVGCDQAYVSRVKADVMSSHNVPTTRKDSKGRNQPTRKPRRQKLPPSTRDDDEPPRVVAHPEVMSKSNDQAVDDLVDTLVTLQGIGKCKDELSERSIEFLESIRQASVGILKKRAGKYFTEQAMTELAAEDDRWHPKELRKSRVNKWYWKAAPEIRGKFVTGLFRFGKNVSVTDKEQLRRDFEQWMEQAVQEVKQ